MSEHDDAFEHARRMGLNAAVRNIDALDRETMDALADLHDRAADVADRLLARGVTPVELPALVVGVVLPPAVERAIRAGRDPRDGQS